MAFNDVVGHEKVKAILRSEIVSGRSAGTYLFWGPEGVGKADMAREFAIALLCMSGQGDSCGVCGSCVAAVRGNHPDFHLIRPDGNFVKIEALRELGRQLLYRPFRGRGRVAILESVEKMKVEAANSMLKTLEEPPPGTTLILVTSHVEALLDTIRSRSRQVGFGRLSPGEVERLLIERHSRAPEDAALLSRISLGSLRVALETDIDDYRRDRERLMAVLEAGREDAVLSAGMALVGAHRRATPETVGRLLSVFYGLVRDMAVMNAHGESSQLLNGDMSKRITDAGALWNPAACDRLMAEVQKASADIARFANRTLLLTGTFCRAARIFASQT